MILTVAYRYVALINGAALGRVHCHAENSALDHAERRDTECA